MAVDGDEVRNDCVVSIRARSPATCCRLIFQELTKQTNKRAAGQLSSGSLQALHVE